MMESYLKRRRLMMRALFSGGCASVASALALTFRGHAEEGSAAGPLNGPSQWLWGGREARTRKLTAKHTAVGYVIHHLSSTGWAALYEAISGDRGTRKPTARIVAEAAGVTAIAFAVDYGLTPRRLQPGFEQHIRPLSIALAYASFAVGLATSTLLRRAAMRRSAYST